MIFQPLPGGGSGETCELTLNIAEEVVYAYFGMDEYTDGWSDPVQNPISVPVGSFVFLQPSSMSSTPITTGVSEIYSVTEAKFKVYIYAITGTTASITIS